MRGLLLRARAGRRGAALKRACRGNAEKSHAAAAMEMERTVQQIMSKTIKPADTWKLFGDILTNKPKDPMVLLLGNHSAGKSTFINSLLGRKVQESGVAPTDDSFTLIKRGDQNADEDGPTLVGTHNHGFQDLSKFGPTFVNHLKLKVRDVDETRCPKGLILVDSPGMIGSPLKGGDNGNSERGYDLLKATRWFAERADVILLLFDPANPGTTGETLDVLTDSLADLEHKFLIVMNKVDQFDNAVDFARAYGALCWNLSKVINRKDIPRIYTMFTDIGEETQKQRLLSESTLPISEFEKTREEVISEVLRAPGRRVDNLLTLLSETALKVYIQAHVSEKLRRSYVSTRNRIRGTSSALFFGSVGALAFAYSANIPVLVAGTAIAATSFIAVDMASQSWLKKYEDTLITGIDAAMKSSIPNANDEDVKAKYNSLRPVLVSTLRSRGLANVPKMNRRMIANLESLIKEDIPKLREKAYTHRYTAKSA